MSVLDPATIDLRALERHETYVHAAGRRDVVDLGDGLVLFDPEDPEPFWNRAGLLRWPADPRAFDRRLTELLALFAIRGRRPHVWPSAGPNEPADLVARLQANGFADAGAGLLMVATTAPTEPHAPLPDGVTLERITADRPGLRAAALVLADAFDGSRDRLLDIAANLGATSELPGVALVLARVDGEPAAVAKATTSEGLSYLSAIGTRPEFRGRGLASLVTRTATAAGFAHGASIAYLGVFADNPPAIRVYRRLGYEVVGEAVPDLLLETSA